MQGNYDPFRISSVDGKFCLVLAVLQGRLIMSVVVHAEIFHSSMLFLGSERQDWYLSNKKEQE